MLARTTAGGKTVAVSLYQTSNAPAAAPWATTPWSRPCGKMLRREQKTAREKVAEQMVPERKPLGWGGVGLMENMMPLAIIGGANSGTLTRASTRPRVAHAIQSARPARSESTSLTVPMAGSTLIITGGLRGDGGAAGAPGISTSGAAAGSRGSPRFLAPWPCMAWTRAPPTRHTTAERAMGYNRSLTQEVCPSFSHKFRYSVHTSSLCL